MPKMAGFSEKEKKFILEQANTFWDEATQRQTVFFQIVTEMQRLTRVLLPAELEAAYAKYPDRSALVPPDIYINMVSLYSTIRKAIFRRKPYFKVYRAGQPNVVDEVVKKAENLLQSCIDHDKGGSRFKVQATMAIKQMLYGGVAAGVVDWHTETARKVQKDEHGIVRVNPITGYVDFESIPVATYPRLTAVDIRRCRIDPGCPTLDLRRITGYHHVEPLSDLLTKLADPSSHYQFDVEKLKRSSFLRDKYFEHVGSENYKYPDKGTDLKVPYGDSPVEVRSIKGLFQLQGEDGKTYYHDLIVEVGNGEILLALKDNDTPIPSWEHFEFGYIDPELDTAFPMGVVEPTRDSFIEQFVKHNQSLDSANRNIYNTYIADKAATEGLPDYLESANDQILRLDVGGAGLQDVRQAMTVLPRPQLGQDTFQHSLVLSRTNQQVMRLSDYVQGRDPSSTETATAVNQIVSGNQAGNENLIDNVVDTFLGPICIKFLTLWNFFQGDLEHTMANREGGTFVLTPGELDIQFHCAIESAIGATSPDRVRRMVEMYPLLSMRPNIDSDLLDQTMIDVLDMPNGDRMLLTADYVQMQVDRENVALSSGVPQPVHPKDNHVAHSKLHGQYIEDLSMMPPERIKALGLNIQEVVMHKAEHDRYLQEMQGALGNVKAGGGLSSNLSAPGEAPMAVPTGGATGNYTPKENR